MAQGIIEKVGRTPVYWSQWLLAQLPALLISVPALWVIILWLFPLETPVLEQGGKTGQAGGRPEEAWSAAEKRGAFILMMMLLLWITDFLHHLHPARVALGIALLAALPRIGALELKDLKQIDFFPFVYTASALSLGDGLMKTGALDIVTHALSSCWQP